MAEKNAKYFYGLGRRKEATARVRLYVGQGNSTANGKTLDEYFGDANMVNEAYAPLKLVGVMDKYHISATLAGGGKSSQAEAIRLGISRALVEIDEANKTTLRKVGYLTRDPREKERKKPGLKRARKAPQFSKR
jgi:small subunit ribosomal protein S9